MTPEAQLAHDALAFWACFAVAVLVLAALTVPFWPTIVRAVDRWLGDDEGWPEGFDDPEPT